MIVSSSFKHGTIMAFHHGISKKEPNSGVIPMRDAQTNVIALLAFSNDADPLVFPLDTPVLITSINKGLTASGTQGNLRASLEAIAAITNPTLVVVRIDDPFSGQDFDQSKVIGTTLETGQRTGLQAFLTAKSILGLTPKIIIVPDVETPAVVQSLASICKKLRAYSYITPRDEFGVMLPTMQDVVTYRDTLGFREIEIIWPEWTSGNVFLGTASTDISCAGATVSASISYSPDIIFDIKYNGNLIHHGLLPIESGQITTPLLLDIIAIEPLYIVIEERYSELSFKNLTNEPQRLEITAYQNDSPNPVHFFRELAQLNKSLNYKEMQLSDVEPVGPSYQTVSFCLSAKV